MKILCVCGQGNKRSVFTRFVLNPKHDAVAIGIDVNSQETINMLAQWADVILLAEPEMSVKFPIDQHKIDKRFTIGEDNFPISIADGKLKSLVIKKLTDLEYI